MLTLQRAMLKGDKAVDGRWIVTKFRDDAPATANK